MGTAPRPKQHPAGGGYGQGNTEGNSDRHERQDEKAVTRRGSTLEDKVSAEDHRRPYAGREEESAQDHTYCSRVTRIHSSI